MATKIKKKAASGQPKPMSGKTKNIQTAAFMAAVYGTCSTIRRLADSTPGTDSDKLKRVLDFCDDVIKKGDGIMEDKCK